MSPMCPVQCVTYVSGRAKVLSSIFFVPRNRRVTFPAKRSLFPGSQKVKFSEGGCMDISMPSNFPSVDFRAFGIAAQKFFPKLLSDEDLNDPHERLRHFQWSWQAVRYLYRLCSECSEEFSALLLNPSDVWSNGSIDEELSYKLEQCIYIFLVSGVSIFDSGRGSIASVYYQMLTGKESQTCKCCNSCSRDSSALELLSSLRNGVRGSAATSRRVYSCRGELKIFSGVSHSTI